MKVLLLNASNMDSFPVYPYAFIQVPALAKRAGIDVVCRDLLGTPREEWSQSVRTLIEQHKPVMILITQRNTDSFTIEDYDRVKSENWKTQPYFPIEQTKELIIFLRGITDLPVAVGGFGFSLLATELMGYLRPDFGVVGGPDDFFGRFQDVLAGDYKDVVNLLYWQNGRLHANQQYFFPPLNMMEYTSSAIKQMMDFYAIFPDPGFNGAPVEIMRGCNHACRFCSEPFVAGRLVRYREPSVIMSDIEMLVEHGINKIYLISSELNPESNNFILNLAERLATFNEQQTADRQVSWFGANYLLDFTFSEYQRLYRSGFTGGWFDMTALDDQNARAMRTPYRNATLLDRLKDYVESSRVLNEEPKQGKIKGANNSDLGVKNNPQRKAIRWSMFLGNSAVTLATIRNTLRIADGEGLPSLFDACHIIRYTRIFDYEKPDSATLGVTYSISHDLRHVPYQQLLPSFAYAPALLNHFGSSKAIDQMFQHIEQTYLSKNYAETREWMQFINNNATPHLITKWLGEFIAADILQPPEFLIGMDRKQMAATVQHRYFPEDGGWSKQSSAEEARQLVYLILTGCFSKFRTRFELFDLPASIHQLKASTPYSLATAVFSRFRSEEELIHVLAEPFDQTARQLIGFAVRGMLYWFNVQIRPQYRALFVEPVNQPANE